MKIKEGIKIQLKSREVNENALNDKNLSRLFASVLSPMLRYVPESKGWYYYIDGVWKRDVENLQAKKAAKIFADALQAYFYEVNALESVLAKVRMLDSKGRRDTMLADAKCEMVTHLADFDKNPNILNVSNGTLDLDTLKLRKHASADLLSKICNVCYDETARCERWEQFIDEITEGDKEKADYIQRVLGYALTGNVHEEEFYILYGSKTRNGKSTLLTTIAHLLNSGDEGYAANANAVTFSGKTEHNGSSACCKQ